MMQIKGTVEPNSALLSTNGDNSEEHAIFDFLCIDGVCSVNPVTKAPTGQPITFILTGIFPDRIEVYPPLVPQGPYQNVDRLPSDDANVMRDNDKRWHSDVVDPHSGHSFVLFGDSPLRTALAGRRMLTAADIPELEAMIGSGIESASDLIKGIEKHGEVFLSTEEQWLRRKSDSKEES